MYKGLCTLIRAFERKIRADLNRTEETAVSRRNITYSNYTAGVVNNLIGGNFFTGLLLLMNADDSFMGLVTMMGFIGNLLQVLSPLLLERFQSRKTLLIVSRAIIYFFNIIIISVIPLMGFTNGIKLMLILVVILLVNLINAITASGFSVWHIKSIPENIRANYFSFFSVTNGIIIYTVIFAFSRIVDYFKMSGNEMAGLYIIRAIALLLCIVDIFFLYKIKEYPNQSSGTNMNLINILLNPFKEKKYLITVFIACLWNFSANIPGPYFTIYMLKDLKVSYSFLNIINMFNIPILIFLTPLWRKRINSTSWFKTLYFSMGLFLLNYICLSLVTKDTLMLYPIALIFSFLVAPGINLVFSNIPFINIPDKDQTNYIGFFSAMNNLAALLGVLMGKEFIRHTEGMTMDVIGIQMQNKQYILILTAIVMLFAVVLIYIMQRRSEKIVHNVKQEI